MHIEGLNNKKLYIGVKTSDDQAKKNESQHKTSSNVNKRNGLVKKNANYNASSSHASTENHLSTFEISTTYISSLMPDILDMYQLKNATYGIQIDRSFGDHKRPVFKISWSPVTM